MENNEGPVKEESLLLRRLNKLIARQKHNSSRAYKVNKKNSLFSILLIANEDPDEGNTFILQIKQFVLRLTLPTIIKPHKISVYEQTKGMSRKTWRYKYANVIYGLGYLPKERVFHIFHGVNSHNQKNFPSDKIKIWTPPWNKFNLTRHRIIDKHNRTFWENMSIEDTSRGSNEAIQILGGICPKLRFECRTEDNRQVIGCCFIEEKQWVRGFTLLGIPLFNNKIITQRVLKIYLQYNQDDIGTKPSHKEIDFNLLVKETMEEGVTRFCKIKSTTRKKNERLYLQHILTTD